MPLMVSKDEWGRITSWAERDSEEAETVQRREYIKYLNDTSREMTKPWPNSLENVNKRNEQERRARIEAAENANTQFYKRYMKRKQELQKRLMYSARDTVFKNKDAPRLMYSAMLESVVQKERQEQLKFQAEQRRMEAEQKRKDDEEIHRRSREWHEVMANKKKLLFQSNKEHQKLIVEQAKEIAERNRKEYEEELRMQIRDNEEANKQIAAIKEFEMNYKKVEKARIHRDMTLSREESEARRRELAAAEDMADRLQQVLLRSNARVLAQRKATEKSVKDEKMRVLKLISDRLGNTASARDAKEEAILLKTQKQNDAAMAARLAGEEARRARARAERRELRRAVLREQAQRDHAQATMHQWDMMNRFKNIELYEDYKEKQEQERRRKIEEFREDALRLWKERDEREAREKAETRYFYGELAMKRTRDADNKLLTYANALIDEARNSGCPDFPLIRAVDYYCRICRLYPLPKLPAALQKHFPDYEPFDGSRPDAGYVEPPPPPGAEPNKPDDKDLRRVGVNHEAGPSKPKKSARAVCGEVCLRASRFNGLQRNGPDQVEGFLPPITVIPCENQTCRCPLRSTK